MTNEAISVWLRRQIKINQNVISRKRRQLEQLKDGAYLQDWLFEERLQAEIDVWAVATDDLRELLDTLTHNMEGNT